MLQPKAESMNRSIFRRAAPALLLGALLGGCGSTAPPEVAPSPAVTVVTLRTEPVNLTRELPGRISPFLIAEVRPQVGGIVKQRLFKEGTHVRAGEPLYRLDDATYRADAQSASAALARATAALSSARLTANRIGELAKIDAVSAQENENAIATLRQAEADVAVARAALDGSNVILGHALIGAPISGRIGTSAVTQGALVTANQADPLATIQQLDPIYVDLTLASSELLHLRKEIQAGTLTSGRDLPVTILLEDGTPYSQTGKFAFADLSVDPATGSFMVRVEVPNPGDLLLPGMYVRAVVSLGQRADAVLVPQPGISRNAKGEASALVVGADGKVEQRDVLVERTIGDRWLVESGLLAGDRVIVEGLQRVRPGASVQATESAPAPPPAAGAVDAAMPAARP